MFLQCAATSAVEELPPNGFLLGFLANHPGFHGFNNPHFLGPAAEADTVDSPEVETDQIDTIDGSGDDEIIVDALPERQEVTDEGNEEEESKYKYALEFRDTVKVECDFLTQPRFSCYSCYDYLECKEKEGKVKSCNNPLAPYCVNGICSPTPSSECAEDTFTTSGF